MGMLTGKVAVITGSSRGIGKGIALRFAGEGADLVLNGREAQSLENALQEVLGLGGRAIAVAADIATTEGARTLIGSAIDRFRKVDILVNNAGLPGGRGSLLEMTEEEWDNVMRVDLKGVFLCTQAVAKLMMDRKYGKIVNVSSSMVGAASATLAYSAAKAGVMQLTKTCARELGSYGINVNSVAPGKVITELSYVGRTPEDVKRSTEERIRVTTLRRLGTVEDMASLVLFLATDESSFISGQTIFCDGGRMDRM